VDARTFPFSSNCCARNQALSRFPALPNLAEDECPFFHVPLGEPQLGHPTKIFPRGFMTSWCFFLSSAVLGPELSLSSSAERTLGSSLRRLVNPSAGTIWLVPLTRIHRDGDFFVSFPVCPRSFTFFPVCRSLFMARTPSLFINRFGTVFVFLVPLLHGYFFSFQLPSDFQFAAP